MTDSTFSSALGADSDHVVCFGQDGTQHRWPALVAAASRVCARLAEEKGQRWALNLDDTFEFTAALLGCWAADKTPVLAPRSMLESDSASMSIDGVIDSGDSMLSADRRVVWQHLPETAVYITHIAPSAQMVLYTSGSTGSPKEISRSLRNVEAELAVLESLWGESVGRCSFYSTVSHRHVYGVLFRVLWPLLTRRPLATYDLEHLAQLIDGHGDGRVLISSPALLKRVGHLPDRSAGWRAIFSSGGLLLRAAALDAARVLGACPIEVLGSTETSGVAWRRQAEAGDTLWKAMPTVEIRAGDDEFLEVRSPFSGRAQWLQMGDMVRFADDGTFELLGRGDHLTKIEDKRVSLAQIEQYLSEHPWVKDAAAVALEYGARQYVGVVLELSDGGVAELACQGRRAFNEALKRALRGRVESVALPRKFRYLEQIPVDAQGKRRQAKLKDLFRSR